MQNLSFAAVVIGAFSFCTHKKFGYLGWFVDLILYIPVNNFSLCQDGSSWVEPVLSKIYCVTCMLFIYFIFCLLSFC